MNLAVSERFTIVTNLSVDEALERLASVVEPPKRQWFGTPSSWKRKPYEGTISGNTFRIERVIEYRNSFLPVIQGEVFERVDGASIEINMNMNSIILGFMTFWLLGVGTFGICILGSTIATAKLGWFDLIPIVMFIGGIAMSIGGFRAEADKSKTFLCNLFGQDTGSTAKP